MFNRRTKEKKEKMREGKKIKLLNMDCLDFMKQCEDNAFDLAIVDPPYGIDADQKRGDTGRNGHIKQRDYHIGNWDKGIPTPEYFAELKRVSKNQIIWGGNYFLDYLGNTSCFIVWDKDNGDNYYADCELAWTSFETAVRKVKYKWHGFLQGDMKNKENRIHPTQKPMKLYRWILETYATPDMKILDTHLGSGSSAIAAHFFGCEFTGIEIDKTYFELTKKRFENDTLQTQIF
jgi:site-specific DNA-methyltransferase (adenine-specific)